MNRKHIILLWFLFFLFSPIMQTEAQTVTKRFNNETLKDVIDEIEKQTHLSFIYKLDALNENERITESFRKTPIRRVLNRILGQDVDYLIENKLIIIYRKQATNTESEQNQRRSYIIEGKVLDAENNPIIGANIYNEDLKNGTISDVNGNFHLEVALGSNITVSSIGYISQDIPTYSRHNITITLKEHTQSLKNVIIIGYGSTTRQNIVGAVDQVKSEEIEEQPTGDVIQILQGTSPNLIIQHRSFNPNNDIDNLNIRGISTTNSNSPLIVIDNMVSADNSLNKLNPNDIDNISILKDAGAAAIYGSRSANGVILVTTKKGKTNGRPEIKFNTMTGMQVPHILYQPVEGYRNAQLRNEALLNSGLPQEFTDYDITDLYKHRNTGTWFMNQIFKTAIQQNYNISVTGGSKNSTYMISTGFYDQQSNYVGNDYGIQRYNIRSNLTTNFGRVKIQALLSYNRNNSTGTTVTNVESDASRVPQYYYYSMKENGKYIINDILSENNPLGSLEDGGTNKSKENLLAELI